MRNLIPSTFSKTLERDGADFSRLPLLVQACKLGHLATVNLRRSKTQFFFERLLEYADVAVFAEYQRDNEPVVARADLAVGAAVTAEFLACPTRDVGRSPAEFFRLFMEGGGVVANIACRQQIAFPDWFNGFANHYTVHQDRIARGEIANGELVLRGNGGSK